MNARPRIVRRAAAATSALLLLLLMGGCSHYHIGIPLVPGLSLGLGATKDGNFSVGLNTGWGPLGAGVSLHDNGAVTGSASVGVGVGVGPIGTGVGVGKSVVLHNPYETAAPAPGQATLGVVVPASVSATAPVNVTKAGVTRPMSPSPPIAAAPVPAARVSYRPSAAKTAVVAGEAGTPGNPIAP
ncbi:hypothetical protein [Variovorax sp. EBFNA2]|uniref:hypothetical protein n=1 Tax=Variovorax sp. EBFNA2 TaxID=3342097 RepID=UPI0029BFE5FB|nr:hypothetical protein [Variovorax boronicumulans]WPG37378.1 hypothetical protein RZE79_28505 [Variovorax boronicumulans]